jgi:hypothetical protein
MTDTAGNLNDTSSLGPPQSCMNTMNTYENNLQKELIPMPAVTGRVQLPQCQVDLETLARCHAAGKAGAAEDSGAA